MFELSKAKIEVESLFEKIGNLDFNAILDRTLKDIVQKYCKQITDDEWYESSQKFFNVWEPSKVFLNPEKNESWVIDLWVEGHIKAAKLKEDATRYNECLPEHDIRLLYSLFDLAGEAYILDWELNYFHEWYTDSLEVEPTDKELKITLVELLHFHNKLLKDIDFKADSEAESVKAAVMELLSNPPKYDFRKEFEKLIESSEEGLLPDSDVSENIVRDKGYRTYVDSWLKNYHESFTKQMTHLFG